MSTPTEQMSFLIELVAGTTIAVAAGWMVFLTSWVNRLERELDEHKIEAEKRLTKLEEQHRGQDN